MADPSIDDLLNGSQGALEYFKRMLALAHRISSQTWPDYEAEVKPKYDRERGIDLPSLRGDATMLRAVASTARQSATDQTTAKNQVETAWPDNAGRAAVTTLTSHQQRSEPIASVFEKAATAAEAVAEAVIAAVTAKAAALKEFDVGVDSTALDGVMTAAATGLMGFNPLVVADFERQLRKDLARFDSAVNTATAAVRKAYEAVPAAVKDVDSSPFPAPTFGTITAPGTPVTPGTGSPGTGSPGTGSPGTGSPGTGSPGTGSPKTGSPSTTSPGTTSPSATAPTSTSPSTASPGTASPTAASPTSANPAATTPAPTSTPSTGNTGVPSWLSQLVPKLTEALTGNDAKDATKDLGKGTDKDGLDKTGKDGLDKDGKDGAGDKTGKPGTKVLGVDALGRTVTATVGPDGKTVEITARRPDGTEEKLTLKVGEDGKFTAAEASAKDGPATGAKPTATAPGTASPSAPSPSAPGTAAPSDPKPAATQPPAPTGATPSVTPAPGAPSPKPATAPSPGGQGKPEQGKEGRPDEPCPPEQQGSGAELALTLQ